MAVILRDPAANQSLPEYCVGAAAVDCVFPGIMQCFAIAGWTQTGMVCTHVSPGASAQDLDEQFGHLLALGGDLAQRWYVAGPFGDHFGTASAQWRSVQHIKARFIATFGNTMASHWILDVTPERASFSWGIDIQAVHCPTMPAIWFGYRQMGKTANPWTNLPLHRFQRF